MAKPKPEAEEFVSGEDPRARLAATYRHPKKLSLPLLPLVVAAIVIAGLGFAAGAGYQKGHDKTANNSSTAAFNGGGRGFGRRAGGIGQVTAISPTSITINNQRSGASQTFSITSSTAINDNGQTVTTSDIQNGATVLIMTNGNGSTTATRILVNPGFGGGFGGQSSAPTDVPTQTN